MPASAAFAAASFAQSSVALAESEHAKTIACQGFIQHFQNDGSTVEQAQQYAECINRLYPQQMTAGEATALKVAIVVVFIGAIFGFIRMNDDDIGGRCVGALIGILVSMLGMFAIFLIGSAVQFLFT